LRISAEGLGRKKAFREHGWSVIIIVIMVAGLSGWVVIPSTGLSLESGLNNYANAAATYIVVSYNGNPNYRGQSLSNSTLAQFQSIAGVESVYPIGINETNVYTPGYTLPPENGNNLTLTMSEIGFTSAVIGGVDGFPPQLLVLSSGAMPTPGSGSFVLNGNYGGPDLSNGTWKMQVGGLNVTARSSGSSQYIPLIGNNLQILWDRSFTLNQLGAKLFGQTFGRINFVIIKATDVSQVSAIANTVTSDLTSGGYKAYNVNYDALTVQNLQSLEAGTAPEYTLLGIVSLGGMVLGVIAVSFVAINRRGWEAGLLVSQGWRFRDVLTYYFTYFAVLLGLSALLATVVSIAVTRFTSVSFSVYAGTVELAPSLNYGYLVGGIAVMLLVCALVSWLMVRKVRRSGLDSILRSF
jgi:FtsX-like permease family